MGDAVGDAIHFDVVAGTVRRREHTERSIAAPHPQAGPARILDGDLDGVVVHADPPILRADATDDE